MWNVSKPAVTLSPRQNRATAILRSIGLRSPEKRRLASEGAWVVSGQVISALGTLAGIRLLTETVSPSVFGAANLLTVMSALGIALACSPFLQAAMRFYPAAVSGGDETVLRATVRYYIARGVVGLITIAIVTGACFGPRAGLPVWIGALVALLIVVDAVKTSELALITAARRQKLYAVWSALDTCSRPLGAVAMVLLFYPSPHAVLGGYTLSSSILLAIFLMLRRKRGVTTAEAPSALKMEFRKYALPLLPLALVGWVSAASNRYIIGGLLGLREVGIYAAASGLIMSPFTMVGTTVMTTLRPLLYSSVSSNDEGRTRRTIWTWTAALVIASTTGAATIAIFREPIASLLLARGYRSSASLMPWLALGFPLLLLSQMYNTISLAYNYSSAMTISEGVGALTSVAATIPLIRLYGLTGAAAAVPLYYGTQCVCAAILAASARRRFHAVTRVVAT